MRIKICGLTVPEDAARAASLGAWALGVIFAAESPRRVDLERAAQVLAAGEREAGAGMIKVGVFVNAPETEIAAAVEYLGLDAVQLHGEETQAVCGSIARHTGITVIKALRVSGASLLAAVAQFDTGYLLLDTYHPERRGGTGEVFDWNVARQVGITTRQERIILAGGINPENLAEAVTTVTPFAVDVSSGVESEPGKKDPDKLKRLFGAASQIRKGNNQK